MSFMRGLASATNGSGGNGNDMTGQGRMLADKWRRIEQGEIASKDPTKAGSASDRMGNLLRSEWDDYVNRFAPYDQRLIGLATSDEDNQQAIGRARENVGSSFDSAAGTMQRNNERLGLSNAADVTQSLNRQTSNSRTLAELSAVNKTRLHAQDRDKSIMSGDAAAGLKSGRLTGG